MVVFFLPVMFTCYCTSSSPLSVFVTLLSLFSLFFIFDQLHCNHHGSTIQIPIYQCRRSPHDTINLYLCYCFCVWVYKSIGRDKTQHANLLVPRFSLRLASKWIPSSYEKQKHGKSRNLNGEWGYVHSIRLSLWVHYTVDGRGRVTYGCVARAIL